MRAFVVFGFVLHTKPRDWLGERLQNDLFCIEWYIKPELSNSVFITIISICYVCVVFGCRCEQMYAFC